MKANYNALILAALFWMNYGEMGVQAQSATWTGLLGPDGTVAANYTGGIAPSVGGTLTVSGNMTIGANSASKVSATGITLSGDTTISGPGFMVLDSGNNNGRFGNLNGRTLTLNTGLRSEVSGVITGVQDIVWSGAGGTLVLSGSSSIIPYVLGTSTTAGVGYNYVSGMTISTTSAAAIGGGAYVAYGNTTIQLNGNSATLNGLGARNATTMTVDMGVNTTSQTTTIATAVNGLLSASSNNLAGNVVFTNVNISGSVLDQFNFNFATNSSTSEVDYALGKYSFVDATSGLTYSYSNSLRSTGNAVAGTFGFASGSNALVFSAIPEPSTYVFVLMGSLLLFIFHKNRNRKITVSS